MKTIIPGDHSVPDLQTILQHAVAPRPIALASTINKKGEINLSPFSFFNLFGTRPPTLIFSPNRRVRDDSTKHTLDNIIETREVVIHMVDFAMVEQVSLSSCEYPDGVNEFIKAGFTASPSVQVACPRVTEAKIAFECKVTDIISMGSKGGAANLIICEILLMHISESLLDIQGHIDPLKTDWVARMGGDYYCRASGEALFEVAKPNRHLGIGVDAVPQAIRNHPLFTANDFGRLGNIEMLPTNTEIMSFKIDFPSSDYLLMAVQFLKENKIMDAWKAIIASGD